MRIMTAQGLVMNVLNQPLDSIEKWPLSKLYAYAQVAAAMDGRKLKK